MGERTPRNSKKIVGIKKSCIFVRQNIRKMKRKHNHGRLVEMEIVGYSKHKAKKYIFVRVNQPRARTIKEIEEGVEQQVEDHADCIFFRELTDYFRKEDGAYYVLSIKNCKK